MDPLGNARWESATKDNVGTILERVFKAIVEETRWQRSAHEYHVGLYAGSVGSVGVRGRSYRDYRHSPATLPDNVCRSLTDTLQSKIVKQRPLPRAMTTRGDWKKQRRARKLNQFIEGIYSNLKVFEKLAPLVYRDAEVCNSGHLAVMVSGKRILCERVYPWELFHDPEDARYGEPRNLYRVRGMDAGRLVALYGDTDGKRKKLREACKAAKNHRWVDDQERHENLYGETTDRVDVLECWHLCDDNEAHEDGEEHRCTGRHVVMIRGHVIVDEPFEWPMFPVVTLYYSEPFVGTYGAGLVEQVEGYQHAINRANEKYDEQLDRSGALLLVPDGSDIIDSDLNNDVGTIVRYQPAGGAPQVVPMDFTTAAVASRVPDLTQRAMANAGISQMSAQSQKPSGITSGVALNALADVETERFMTFGRQVEAFHLELSKAFVQAAKQVARDEGEFEVGVEMRSGILSLKWSDVEIDGYQLRMFATNEMSTKPAAQLERLEQWFNAGVFDADTLFRLSDNPDVAYELELRIADKMVIDDTLERFLDADEDSDAYEDVYLPPTPYQDYEWGARRAQQKLNRAILDGAPEFNQQFLRDYIADCEGEIKRIAEASAPPAPPGGAMPPPGPGMPPGMMPPDPSMPPMVAA